MTIRLFTEANKNKFASDIIMLHITLQGVLYFIMLLVVTPVNLCLSMFSYECMSK